MILWNQPTIEMEDGLDLALSFQEEDGCSYVWYFFKIL